MEPQFDAKAVLQNHTAKELPAALGNYSLEQLAALEAAEREGGNRKTVLVTLIAEREARLLASPGIELGDDSIGRLAGIAYMLAGGAQKTFADLEPDQQENVIEGALDVLRDSGPADDFGRVVLALAPLFVEIEALREQAQPSANLATLPSREEVDTSKRKTEAVTDDIAAIALCSAGGTVQMRLTPSSDDWRVYGRKAFFHRPVIIEPEAPAMAISEVVALDEAERVLATTRWPVPLTGGGGNRAMFPAASIAFDL